MMKDFQRGIKTIMYFLGKFKKIRKEKNQVARLITLLVSAAKTCSLVIGIKIHHSYIESHSQTNGVYYQGHHIKIYIQSKLPNIFKELAVGQVVPSVSKLHLCERK